MRRWIELNLPNSVGSAPFFASARHIRVVREYVVDPKSTRVEFDYEHRWVVHESVSEVMSLIAASRHADSEEA